MRGLNRLSSLRCRSVIPVGLLFLAGALVPAGVVAGTEGGEYRVLVVGDSWSQFMWDDRSLRDVFAAEGHPEILEKGDVTALSGTRASEWAQPEMLQLITDELVANPTIDVVQLTMGGNDFLVGQPEGGWYVDISPTDQAELFDRVAGDIEIVIDHIALLNPRIRVVVSLYDYLNFVESLGGLLGFFCTPYFEDMLEPEPLELNTAMTQFIDYIDQRFAQRSQVRHVRHLGLMQFVFGYPSLEIPPGLLLPPGDLTLPSPPQAMRFFQSDCIHLNSTGHLAVAQNLWENYYSAIFEAIFEDGFESGDTSAWLGR